MTHNINSTYIHRMLVTSILSMKYLGRNTSMVSFFFSRRDINFQILQWSKSITWVFITLFFE